MKSKSKRKLNIALNAILILIECTAVIICCALINLFSELNILERERRATQETLISGIDNSAFISMYETAMAEYEEAHRWKGPVLSKSKGTVIGPSGKETYYNLNMSVVVNVMRSLGYDGEYWVRDDGCKMLGDYIMVAANLDLRPKGTLVETSLGTGIVCDTGGFARRDPTQLDIAVTW